MDELSSFQSNESSEEEEEERKTATKSLTKRKPTQSPEEKVVEEQVKTIKEILPKTSVILVQDEVVRSFYYKICLKSINLEIWIEGPKNQ